MSNWLFWKGIPPHRSALSHWRLHPNSGKSAISFKAKDTEKETENKINNCLFDWGKTDETNQAQCLDAMIEAPRFYAVQPCVELGSFSSLGGRTQRSICFANFHPICIFKTFGSNLHNPYVIRKAVVDEIVLMLCIFLFAPQELRCKGHLPFFHYRFLVHFGNYTTKASLTVMIKYRRSSSNEYHIGRKRLWPRFQAIWFHFGLAFRFQSKEEAAAAAEKAFRLYVILGVAVQ